VADGRSVSQPLAIYLGGDVLTSSDPGFGDGSRERADAREPIARDLAARMDEGEAVADELAALGVRWVVDIPVTGEPGPHLDGDDPGLRPVHVDADIALYEVEGWAAGVRTEDGAAVDVDRPIAPLLSTDDGEVRVAAPGSTGWRRAGAGSGIAEGQLLVPAGGGLAWYPGTAAVLVADVVAMGLAVAVGGRWARRSRAREPHVRRADADGARTPSASPVDEDG
jgi:hypothetical protein